MFRTCDENLDPLDPEAAEEEFEKTIESVVDASATCITIDDDATRDASRDPLLQKKKTPGKVGKYLSGAAQISLGLIGVGAGAFYIGPADTCALQPGCGSWLTELTSKEVSVAIFSAGGLDYAGINAYFSAISVRSFVNYIKKQETMSAKIGKGSVIIFYALSQDIVVLLTSLSTSTAFWQVLLTVGGATPSMLYGSVAVMEYQVPHLASKMKYALHRLRGSITDWYSPVSDEERLYRARVLHYRAQHTHFNARADANWHAILQKMRHLPVATEIANDTSLLEFLFQQHAEPSHSIVASAVYRASQVVGAALALNFSAPYLRNALDYLELYVPTLPLQLIVIGFLGSSQAYSNFKLAIDAVTGLTDHLYHLLTCQPINSLTYQLRPKTTLAVGTACLALAALSYSPVDVVFDDEFPGDDVGLRQAFRIGAIIGIDLYHLAGMMHFYHLSLSTLTQDQREKFIFKLEREVARVTSMTVEEFAKFAEKNSPEFNQQCGIDVFAPQKPVESANVAASTVVINIKEPVVATPTVSAQTSWFSSWGSWFKRGKPDTVFAEPSADLTSRPGIA